MTSLGPIITTQLRSGGTYRLPTFCTKPHCEFYGTDINNNLCTEHAGIVHTPPPSRMNNPEFRGHLDRWVDEHPQIVKSDSQLGRLIVKLIKARSALIFGVMERIWITSEFALQLLSAYNRTYENTHASHVILPYVLDWWNIKGINGFLSYERCYYGDNAHKLPTQVPPLHSELNRRCGVHGPRYYKEHMHLT